VRLDRPLTKEQCGGDFPVRSPLGNEDCDAALCEGQPLLAGSSTDPA
jgi:hypothetical protein